MPAGSGPAVGWEDLVLPDRPLAQLHELALRARHRDRVLGDWRLSAGGGRGRGVLGLFAGESGTGKTLSAEVVAAELGLDLYVVQLSSVVDKYVGETEKNLERIFTEADRTDAVLLFDEADAVFGKRSEVKDSHDRYANMESAYLLQRLESFDGIALLTTNLRANIDEAFTRRLDLVVDFPFPDAEQRLALWRHSLAHVPCAEDIEPAAVRPRLRAGRRLDPQRGGHRRLPRGRARRPGHDGRPAGGRPPRVPQGGPAGAGRGRLVDGGRAGPGTGAGASPGTRAGHPHPVNFTASSQRSLLRVPPKTKPSPSPGLSQLVPRQPLLWLATVWQTSAAAVVDVDGDSHSMVSGRRCWCAEVALSMPSGANDHRSRSSSGPCTTRS